jgi:hypothetical protein
LENTGLLYATEADSVYNFHEFSPIQKCLPGSQELEPVQVAVVHGIEEIMGMHGSDPDFKELGPRLLGIVDLLEKYFELYPDDVDLEYIFDELVATAKGFYVDQGESVSHLLLYIYF